MLCIHVGPGRLGLGLIVQQLIEADFSVCVVGHGESEPEEYEKQFAISYTDPDIGLVPEEVQWITNALAVDDLPAEVLDLLETDQPLLITCSLDAAIAARAAWIIELVERRPHDAETVLLACENDPHPAYQEVAAACGAKLQMPPCVVDRICSWALPRRTEELSPRIVRAHPVGEWVVSCPGPIPETLEQLSRASLVQVTECSIEGFKARKLWSVNGVHMVLALVALTAGVNELPLDQRYTPEFLELAQPLIQAMSVGVESRWPYVGFDERYASERIRAFLESPDGTARILKGYLVRSDLRPFMRRLDERLGEPARAVREAGGDVGPFFEAMALIVEVLVDLRLYYSPEDYLLLDPEIDREVLTLFEEVLSSWLNDRAASNLLKTLSRALERHYGHMTPVRH
ncbi:MAG: hypothetical protein WAN93_00885 [Solirubrobacteraceae bacterium]